MTKATHFHISATEETTIVAAIARAEQQTSGEIRVHIESKISTKPPVERAQEVFLELNMHETEQRNGVLFYIHATQNQFAIIGDIGIDEKVGADFWESTKDAVISHFKEQKFAEGLVAGILEAGQQLQHFFPYQENDTNELSNEISRD